MDREIVVSKTYSIKIDDKDETLCSIQCPQLNYPTGMYTACNTFDKSLELAYIDRSIAHHTQSVHKRCSGCLSADPPNKKCGNCGSISTDSWHRIFFDNRYEWMCGNCHKRIFKR